MNRLKQAIQIMLLSSIFICPVFATSDVDVCGIDDPLCQELIDDAIEKSSDLLSKGVLSFDEKIRAQEIEQDYYKYFTKTMQVPTALTFDAFNMGDYFIPAVISFLLIIVESILGIFSWLVMLLYNVSSSSLITSLFNVVGDTINQVFFDWENVNGLGINLLMFIGVISVLMNLLFEFRRHKNLSMIFTDIVKIILNIFIVYFIATSGRNIVLQMENKLAEGIGAITNIETSENIEIQTKEQIFNLLQFQPYIYRNFGLMDISKIEDGEERVYNLLNDSEYAKQDIKKYNNEFIIRDVDTGAQAFTMATIMSLHRLVLTPILLILCCAYLVFTFIKELLLMLAFLNVIKLLFDKRNMADWFLARILWAVLAVIVQVLFALALNFLFEAIAYISTINILAIIVFDTLMLILLKIVYQHKKEIIDFVFNAFKSQRELYNSTDGTMQILNYMQNKVIETVDGKNVDFQSADKKPSKPFKMESTEVELTEKDTNLSEPDETVEKDNLKDTKFEQVGKNINVERHDQAIVIKKETKSSNEKNDNYQMESRTKIELNNDIPNKSKVQQANSTLKEHPYKKIETPKEEEKHDVQKELGLDFNDYFKINDDPITKLPNTTTSIKEKQLPTSEIKSIAEEDVSETLPLDVNALIAPDTSSNESLEEFLGDIDDEL